MKKLAIYLSVWVFAGAMSACGGGGGSAAYSQAADDIKAVATAGSVSVVTAQ